MDEGSTKLQREETKILKLFVLSKTKKGNWGMQQKGYIIKRSNTKCGLIKYQNWLILRPGFN